MNTNGLTLSAMTARLDAAGLPYGVMDLQNRIKLLLVERGGRVFGPFLDDDSAGLYWVNPVWQDPAALAQFLARNEWNVGGERVWVAPEVQYLVTDRTDFWGSLHFPPQMDPGTWALTKAKPDEWQLRQALTLAAHNLATGSKDLVMERLLRPVADPLTNSQQYTALLDGVHYAGYEQVVTLTEGQHDAIMSQAWILIQLNPGGQLFVPCATDLEITDYNEPVDAAHCTRHSHWTSFQITGQRRYKVGLRAVQTFGRLAYFNQLDAEHAYLLVRNYFNNPSSPYVEEPAHLPGVRGDSIHIYNDGGMFGGFGELETQGQTIGGSTGLSSTSGQQVLWLYVGAPAKLAAIARQLLGVELEQKGVH